MRTLTRTTKTLAREAAAALGPHRRRRGAPRLWVLAYHRILPAGDPRTEAEEPGMVVTPATFRRQLEWLHEHFEVMRLIEWLERAAAGRALPPRACALTFDDGWRDNYEFAWPQLRRRGIPATVFAVSARVGTPGAFWPNRLARVLRRLGAQTPQAPASHWLRRMSALAPGVYPDREAIARTIAACHARPDDEMLERVRQAEAELGLRAPPERLLADTHELAEMADSGLIDIGSHTRRHTRLTEALSPAARVDEIAGSRAELERVLARPVRLFCYPAGARSPGADALVRAHYDAAVTTQRGLNTPATPAASLRRLAMHEDVTATRRDFLARLSGWV